MCDNRTCLYRICKVNCLIYIFIYIYMRQYDLAISLYINMCNRAASIASARRYADVASIHIHTAPAASVWPCTALYGVSSPSLVSYVHHNRQAPRGSQGLRACVRACVYIRLYISICVYIRPYDRPYDVLSICRSDCCVRLWIWAKRENVIISHCDIIKNMAFETM